MTTTDSAMSATAAVTIDDITVTLSCSISPSALGRLNGDSESFFSTEDRQLIFRLCHLEMPKALHQAHDTLSRSLLAGACNVLQEKASVGGLSAPGVPMPEVESGQQEAE